MEFTTERRHNPEQVIETVARAAFPHFARICDGRRVIQAKVAGTLQPIWEALDNDPSHREVAVSDLQG